MTFEYVKADENRSAIVSGEKIPFDPLDII
jgi:hypothetical protein